MMYDILAPYDDIQTNDNVYTDNKIHVQISSSPNLFTVRGCPKMSDISISECPIINIVDCPNLKHVSFRYCSDVKNIINCSSLSSATFECCCQLKYVPDMPNVKTLSLLNCSIESFQFEFEALETLECLQCPSLTSLPKNMGEIIYLHLDGCKRIRHIPNLPKIRYLNISRQVWQNCFHHSDDPHSERCYPHLEKIITIQKMVRTVSAIRKSPKLPKCLKSIVIECLYGK